MSSFFSEYGLFAFMVALLVLPAMALYHMIQNEYKGRTRLIWLLIILFLPFFGPILYFIMVKRYRKFNPD